MKFISIVAAPFICSKGLCQIDIELSDVSKHVGDSIKVVDQIYSGKNSDFSEGSPTFLDVGGKYPNAPLTLIIWDIDVRKQFYKQMPEVILKGKECVIYGK